MKSLSSASTWSTIDIFSDSFLADVVKYGRIDDAQRAMEQLRIALRRFGTELRVTPAFERCTAVIEAAKEAGMTIVCAHVEGMSRRTDANDQASIDAILPLADVIVCVEDSDSDGLFSTYAEENDVPIIIVPDALSLSEYME